MIKDLYASGKKNRGCSPVALCCPFCGNSELEEYVDTARRFFRCGGCGGVFVHPECFLTQHEQSVRYLLHKNTLNPIETQGGYRDFLTKFANTTLAYVHKVDTSHKLTSIFDYGAGPEPALVQLLEEYKTSGRLPHTTEIRGWDPFFSPNAPFFENGADLVLCLEVAEHFENPIKGFAGLARASRIGGIVALQTMIVPKSCEGFKKWWYKEDTTHVSFYSQQALELCAKNAGLIFEVCIDSVFIFQKKDE